MAKKGDREILVISSQDTEATTPDVSYPSITEVSMEMLPVFIAPIADQMATV